MSKADFLKKTIKPGQKTPAPAAIDIIPDIEKQVKIKYQNVLQNSELIEKAANETILDLYFLQKNQDVLFKVENITFERLLKEKLKISKQYYYEKIKAYELCLDFKDEAVFYSVDYKKLVLLNRIENEKKKKDVFKKIENYSRAEIQNIIKESKPGLLPEKENIIDAEIINDKSPIIEIDSAIEMANELFSTIDRRFQKMNKKDLEKAKNHLITKLSGDPLAVSPMATAHKSTQARKDFYLYFHALLTTSEAATISTVLIDLLDRIQAARPKDAKKIFENLSEKINDLS